MIKEDLNMSKKPGAILQELELKDVDGFSEAQKSYYSSLGFKPYRYASGKIKWLMPDQHSLRIQGKHKRSFLARLFTPPPLGSGHRRKHRPALLKLIQRNWIMFWAMLLIIAALIVLIGYPHLVF